MLARYVLLMEGGDVLQTVNIFSSNEAYIEFSNDPMAKKAKAMWDGRDWKVKKEVVQCADFIDVGRRYQCHD